jgi:peptidyl-prolyl cis-trans isomerase B (cyclophilin B)
MKHGWIIAVLIVLVLGLVIAGCGKRGNESAGSAGSENERSASGSIPQNALEAEAPAPEAWTAPHADTNPVVTIEMDNGKQIEIELFPDIAPNTVNNFISLAKQGFYDGLIFHRVIPGFMIQGGDPLGNGTGGPGYAIKGEFSANGFPNGLPHKRGVISMARAMAYDSAGSQFFIMVDEAPHLDGQYAAFGYVIQGMETVDEIVMQEIDPSDQNRTRPLNPMAIKKVTVDTKGVDYPEPEVIK